MTELTSTADVEEQILRALADIRKHWHALIEPSAGGSGAGKSADEVTSLDRRVSLRHEVTLALNGWARVVVEERDLTHWIPLGTDALGLVTFLQRHARWFSGHEAAPDAADELTEWARQVRSTAAPQRRSWVYLGDCPFVIEDWFCQGQVRAWQDSERLPSCSDCGQEAVVEWWMDVLDVVPTVTREQLPDFVRRQTGRAMSRVTLWRWLGDLKPSGVDADGREVFDKGAIAYLLTRRGVA